MDKSDLERAFDRVEALADAKSLASVVRSTNKGTPALLVRDRVFARLFDGQTLMLHCPLEQKVLLMEISPDIYFETDKHIGLDIVLIRLGAIDDEELGLRLQDAWQLDGESESGLADHAGRPGA